MTSSPVVASLSTELTITLTGRHSALSAGLSDTNQAEHFIEDIAIEHLLYESSKLVKDSFGQHMRRLTTHDLLEGVDTSEPNVQLFLTNPLSCIEDQATEALFLEMAE